MIRESKGSAEIPASGSEVCIESREGNPESMMPILEGVDFAFNMAPLPLARSYRQTMQAFGLNWKICNDVTVPEREEFEGIRMAVSVMDLRGLRRERNIPEGEGGSADAAAALMPPVSAD
jgi:hypothetical protein